MQRVFETFFHFRVFDNLQGQNFPDGHGRGTLSHFENILRRASDSSIEYGARVSPAPSWWLHAQLHCDGEGKQGGP